MRDLKGEGSPVPFDGTNYKPEPEQPARPSAEERIFMILLIVIALTLLFMPISLAALGDLVHYTTGR